MDAPSVGRPAPQAPVVWRPAIRGWLIHAAACHPTQDRIHGRLHDRAGWRVAIVWLVVSLGVPLRGVAAGELAPATRPDTVRNQPHKDDEPVVPIWRPLLADPREADFKMQWVTFHEDWRFGTDITDSTTHGGYVAQQGVYWDVSFGGNFHFFASDPSRGSTR